MRTTREETGRWGGRTGCRGNGQPELKTRRTFLSSWARSFRVASFRRWISSCWAFLLPSRSSMVLLWSFSRCDEGSRGEKGCVSGLSRFGHLKYRINLLSRWIFFCKSMSSSYSGCLCCKRGWGRRQNCAAWVSKVVERAAAQRLVGSSAKQLPALPPSHPTHQMCPHVAHTPLPATRNTAPGPW